MRLSFRAFWMPKHGSSPEEYEDAYSPRQFADEDYSSFKCAVADGATETSFSGLWAQLLTDGYVAGITALEALQKDWLEKVSNKELPWYAEQKLESGAFAAIVGLTLDLRGDKPAWKAKALGDSCLFLIRQNQIEQAFPLTEWQQFNSTPLLLCSKPGPNDAVLEKVVETQGFCQPGDIFYLLSDAISCWFLRREAEMKDGVQILENIREAAQLEEIVDAERNRKDETGKVWMTNDDVTLLRVQLAKEHTDS